MYEEIDKLKEAIFNMKNKGFRRKDILKIMGITITQYNYISNHVNLSKEIKIETTEQKIKREILKQKSDKNKAYAAAYRAKRRQEPYYLLSEKIKRFQKRSKCENKFTYLDIVNKFGNDPKCYISGAKIDYRNPDTYQLDHIISVHKGGSSELDNLQLINPTINQMKTFLSIDEFINLCEMVCSYNSDKTKHFIPPELTYKNIIH